MTLADLHDMPEMTNPPTTPPPTTQPPPPATAAPAPPAPTGTDSTAAVAKVPEVHVYDRPAGDHVASFAHPTPMGSHRVFLVHRAEGEWLEVYLPARPNGTTGWVHRDQVSHAPMPWRIDVDVASRTLVVSENGTERERHTVAVGKAETPTPTGLFYVTDVNRTGDPTGPYGPMALGLSGFSDVLLQFGGGPGQIGIHGTNAPASLGQGASSGCIRLPNDVVTHLAGLVPLGTPVRIK